jgi:hypothetical protein
MVTLHQCFQCAGGGDSTFWVPLHVALSGVSQTAASLLLLLLLLLLPLTACRFHDPVIVDGWSGYQHERNQVKSVTCQLLQCDVPVNVV